MWENTTCIRIMFLLSKLPLLVGRAYRPNPINTPPPRGKGRKKEESEMKRMKYNFELNEDGTVKSAV